MNSQSNIESRLVKFDRYDYYYGHQIYPICLKTSFIGIVIILVFILKEYLYVGLSNGFYKYTFGYLFGALFSSFMILAAVNRHFKNRIFWIIIFGNISAGILVATNILVELRFSSIIHIIVFFMFGALIIAPLLSVRLFLIPNLILNVIIVFMLMAKSVSSDEFTKIMLFSLTATIFVSFILNYLRKSSFKLYDMAKQNYYFSNLDTLSQLLNRRSWYESSEKNCRRACECKENVAFIMLDIDHFKKINDTWGHSCGDLVIKEVSYLLLTNTRESDIVGRLGGEEFGILLPLSTFDEAITIAERIRTSIACHQIDFEGNKICVTASLGLVYSTPENLDILIKKGDDCLYQAKNSGRNRVVYHSV